MKLLGIEMSKVISLFQMSRSAGQLFLPEAAIMLSGRYSFAKPPGSYEELAGERVEFKHGLYQGSAIESIEFYRDGVVISSRSDTDFIDAFLDDLKDWLTKELGVSFVVDHSVNLLYESHIVVETDKEILSFLSGLDDMCKLINENLKRTSGLEVEYKPFGLALGADQTLNPHLKPLIFRIERRLGTEFSRNRFISSAPLRTNQHIDLIRKLESSV